jgi:hypothetical protein
MKTWTLYSGSAEGHQEQKLFQEPWQALQIHGDNGEQECVLQAKTKMVVNNIIVCGHMKKSTYK